MPQYRIRRYSVQVELPEGISVHEGRKKIEDALNAARLRVVRVWRPAGAEGARIRQDEGST